jgi:hypothetical protein
MAIRYYAQFEDLHGTEFSINIYDSAYSGSSPFEFNVGSEGFRLEYEMEDKFTAICPSTVIVPMLLQNNNDAALLTNLVSSVEGRYILEIRSGGSTYADGHVYWLGIILPEFIEVEDEAYPQLVELRAMDDLSNLRTIDYLQSPEGTGYAYTRGHLANCLNLLRQWSITADTDRFLFVEALEAYDNDAVWYAGHQMQLNFATFKDPSNEPPTYWTAYEVLEQILLAYGARIYWRPSIDTDEKSLFVIDSWVMHVDDDEDFTGYTVGNDGTLSAQQVHERPQFNLDSTGINRIKGWRHGYLPSIREVRREFDYLETNPFTIDHVIDQVDLDNYIDASVTFTTAPELHFGEGTPASVRFRFKFTIEPDATPIVTSAQRMQLVFTLRLGQYYAIRNYTQADNNLPFTTSVGDNKFIIGYSYDPAEWSTSAGSMIFFSPGFDLYAGGTFEMDCSVDLPALPADLSNNTFSCEVASQLITVTTSTGAPNSYQYANTVSNSVITNLSIYPSGIYELTGSTVVFKAVNDAAGGRYKLELPEAKISDLVVNRGGGIFVLPIGGDRFQPSKWRSLADTSVELNLHNVICRDWMKSQPANIRRMVGTIYDHRSAPDQCLSPFATFTHNSVPYAVVAMTYVAGENLYDVELVELDYGGTVTTPAVGFTDGILPTPITPPSIASGFTDAEVAVSNAQGTIDSVVPLRDGIVSLVADLDNFVSVGDDTFEVNVGTVKILEADDVSATFNVPVTIDLQGETFEVLNAGFANPLTVTTDSVDAMDLNIISASSNTAGRIQFNEAADNGNNGITIKAPNSLAGNTNYILPATDGTSGQSLKTDGSGNLYWG